MSKISQLESGIILVEPGRPSETPAPQRRTIHERVSDWPEAALQKLYEAMTWVSENNSARAWMVQSRVIEARDILSDHGIEIEQLC